MSMRIFPKIWVLRSYVVLTYISDLLPNYGFWHLMSTMERVPGQLEVSQHVQKICAPLIILSSQYLLSKTFTNIKVYVQRLANFHRLLWCHSCLWGWTGVKMNKMSLSQTTWRLHGEAKVIIRMIFAGNPGPQDCSFFFQRLFQRLASQVCKEQNYSLINQHCLNYFARKQKHILGRLSKTT